MNQAHFHLVVNHLPIIFPIAALLVLLAGYIAKSPAVKRTSYMLFVIGSISTLMAMNSGEGAEEIVEHINGIEEDYIEKHEESAETFAILSYLLGLLSLIAFWACYRLKSFASFLSYAVLVFALVVIYFGRETGTTGGEIRHTEIRADFKEIKGGDTHEESEHEH
jgi:uncharacterized membrane protein